MVVDVNGSSRLAADHSDLCRRRGTILATMTIAVGRPGSASRKRGAVSEPAVRAPVDARGVVNAALDLFADRGYRATTMADIGVALGIRGPSLYKHVRSKHDLLNAIMLETMHTLIANQRTAVSAGGPVSARLRGIVEAHVRYHAEHRREAFVGNREIGNLVHSNGIAILALRDSYERGVRSVIQEGCDSGAFVVESPRIASYAILDMGMGVATWFRPDGPQTVEALQAIYGEIALRLVNSQA